MTESPTAKAIRAELRTKTRWLVGVAVVLTAIDLVLFRLAGGLALRVTGAIAGAIADSVIVVVIGSWLLRRPLLRAIDTLEYQALAAEELRSHAEQLASAGRIAAGLAHEVGNPLCAITNYAHRLHERVTPELRPTVGSLQREVTRIERLMDGFTDHARPREPGTRGADVNAAIRETLGFLGDQGILRRITIDTELDGAGLPVYATGLELEQIFTNLVLNAADAMRGGGRLAVRTRRLACAALAELSQRTCDDPGDGAPRRASDARLEQWVAMRTAADIVEIVVTDSGHGVTSGDEERIFEPFVTSKEPERGSGLGLAIVRRLVDSMSGLMWVQPSREGGAAFHVVLPVYTAVQA
jgi:signal transduction histidine kinase